MFASMSRASVTAIAGRRVVIPLFIAIAFVLSNLAPQADARLQSDDDPPVAPPVDEPETEEDRAWKSYDQQLLEVAQEVPAFGGLFLSDDEETLNVWLTDRVTGAEARQENARRARETAARVLEDVSVAAAVARPLRADFSWEELHDWHMRLFTDLDVDHVFTDIDETINRIVIGVGDPGRQGAEVRARAAALGVPPSAIQIAASSPFEFGSSLRDEHTVPLAGDSRSDGFEQMDSKGSAPSACRRSSTASQASSQPAIAQPSSGRTPAMAKAT